MALQMGGRVHIPTNDLSKRANRDRGPISRLALMRILSMDVFTARLLDAQPTLSECELTNHLFPHLALVLTSIYCTFSVFQPVPLRFVTFRRINVFQYSANIPP